MATNTNTKRVKIIVYSDVEIDTLKNPVGVAVHYDHKIPLDKEEEINKILADAASRIAKILER